MVNFQMTTLLFIRTCRVFLYNVFYPVQNFRIIHVLLFFNVSPTTQFDDFINILRFIFARFSQLTLASVNIGVIKAHALPWVDRRRLLCGVPRKGKRGPGFQRPRGASRHPYRNPVPHEDGSKGVYNKLTPHFGFATQRKEYAGDVTFGAIASKL
jgi:hypothetical protein